MTHETYVRYMERIKADPDRWEEFKKKRYERSKRYYKTHPEKSKEYKRQQYVKHRLNNLEKRKKYYREHREQELARYYRRMKDPAERKKLAEIAKKSKRRRTAAKRVERTAKQAQSLYEQTKKAVADFEKLFENWE